MLFRCSNSMKKLLLWSALLFLAAPFVNAQSTGVQNIQGKLVSEDGFKPIEGVNVYNNTRNTGDASDAKGQFQLKAAIGDTLFISHVNYKIKKVGLTKKNFGALVIVLKPLNIMLDEVAVYNMPKTVEEFKRKVMKTEAPEEFHVQGMPYIIQNEIPLEYDPRYYKNPLYAINHPVSALIKAFSKDEKMKAKYYKIKAEAPTQRIVEQKFNRDLVQRFTGLEGDSLTTFIQYCHFPKEFILSASNYEIIQSIQNKYRLFLQEQGIEPQPTDSSAESKL